MKENKVKIPEDRAKLYETLTGSKPSDNVEINHTTNNMKIKKPEIDDVINSFFTVIRFLVLSISFISFISVIVLYTKQYFAVHVIPINLTIGIAFSLFFSFFGKSFLIFLVFGVFTILLEIGVNFIEFLVYLVLIVINKINLSKLEKEYAVREASVKDKLSELDKKDEENLSKKTVDFSNTED